MAPKDLSLASIAFTPVILSGGSGSRLWPISRKAHPKQFLSVVGDGSMIQETALRVSGSPGCGAPVVICAADQRFLVREHMLSAGMQPTIVLEAMGRNTAFPVALAAIMAAETDPDRVLVILPADHNVPNADRFLEDLPVALEAARDTGCIITFGIVPSAPETGFGYIKTVSMGQEGDVLDVDTFVEKPDAETAQSYFEDGHYLWNSGMFVATARTLLAAFEANAPDVFAAAMASFAKSEMDLEFIRLGAAEMARSPDLPFDIAVMEQAKNIKVVRGRFAWSDLGSWEAIWQVGDSDANGNVAVGNVVALDTQNSYIRASDGPMVATLGVEDLVVVAMRDAVLVADRTKSQDLKQVVQALRTRKRPEADIHAQIFRPWGSYETICMDDRFQVKRIVVKPKGKLSLQSHLHRSEHWVVVSGTAIVTIDGEEQILRENESVYIPLGAHHRLENRGKIDLHLIEVQSGSYLGEDDIIRYEDIYARV
ncbi:MAG: mannose-1-phosphate guanylyltransferase/mannose-6-phosphate isomerase [Pseudomonadota bacterium]